MQARISVKVWWLTGKKRLAVWLYPIKKRIGHVKTNWVELKKTDFLKCNKRYWFESVCERMVWNMLWTNYRPKWHAIIETDFLSHEPFFGGIDTIYQNVFNMLQNIVNNSAVKWQTNYFLSPLKTGHYSVAKDHCRMPLYRAGRKYSTLHHQHKQEAKTGSRGQDTGVILLATGR